MRPSFIFHQIAAVFTTIGTLAGFYWLINNYQNTDSSYVTALFLIMAIAWSVHAANHFHEEVYYDFNPLVGKVAVQNEPIVRSEIRYNNYNI